MTKISRPASQAGRPANRGDIDCWSHAMMKNSNAQPDNRAETSVKLDDRTKVLNGNEPDLFTRRLAATLARGILPQLAPCR